MQIDADIDVVEIVFAVDDERDGALRQAAVCAFHSACVTSRLECAQQAINEIRFRVCCETRSNRVDDLLSCEGAAERNVAFTDAVTAPSADFRARMRNRIRVAIDDTNLTIIEVRVAARKLLERMLGSEPLRQQVDREPVIAWIRETLRDGYSGVRPDRAIAVKTYCDGIAGGCKPELPGSRA